jgi:hypothetical protein
LEFESFEFVWDLEFGDSDLKAGCRYQEAGRKIVKSEKLKVKTPGRTSADSQSTFSFLNQVVERRAV